uniref:HAT C-terminal dimerisation domain-containing protein n=1 Tax=Lactuca sativa TaxID=4236 RepID=A0A9R1VF23_LACSA|nr:hypothetical protein LSAT_V11C500255730 [Lactuca sativa]
MGQQFKQQASKSTTNQRSHDHRLIGHRSSTFVRTSSRPLTPFFIVSLEFHHCPRHSSATSLLQQLDHRESKRQKQSGRPAYIDVKAVIGPLLEKAKNLCDHVEKVLRDLYAHYSHEVGVINENRSSSSENVDEEIVIDVDDDPTTFLNNQYIRLLEENSSGIAAKCELDWYLGEQCKSLDNKFDLLAWWKKNQARFPIIAAIAKDVLEIPASTVASESSFNTGGRVLDEFCCSLIPETVDALICCQNWLRSKNVPIDIEESFEALENYGAEVKDLPQAISALTVWCWF